MSDAAIEKRWRLNAAAFLAAEESRRFANERARREAVDLLVYVLAHDVGLLPKDLDGEHVRDALRRILPGRLSGGEAYAWELPDILEAFLRFMTVEEGLSTTWELASAVDQARDDYEKARKDPARPALGHSRTHAPAKRAAEKIGRNDPCFCGSGKKYKNCCLRLLD